MFEVSAAIAVLDRDAGAALSITGQQQRLTARKKAERVTQNLFRTTRER
jgi:hypothetical protein